VAKLVISRRATDDFKRIWTYIAADSERAADRLLLAIDARIQLLSVFPEIGPRRDDLRPGLRMLVHGRYLVLYEFLRDVDAVEIVAVVEGLRDLGELF
jgi:toxin ParE1/3/4